MSLKKLQKVYLLSGNTPSTNPRVVKEAQALSEHGFEVTFVTSALPSSAVKFNEKTVSFKIRNLNRLRPAAARWRHRILRRTAFCWSPGLRIQISELGSLFLDLFRFLKNQKNEGFNIFHLEPALLAGHVAGLLPHAAVDFEDWYSEDLMPGSRTPPMTSLLREAEKNVLYQSIGSWCPSRSMASGLVNKFGGGEPKVIRNVFPLKDRESIDRKWKDRPGMARWMSCNDPQAARPKEAPVSIHWFSQTVGPGRGLEALFQALDGLEGNWELHLRGNLKGYEGWLERACSAGVRGRLKVHELVENEELLSRIAEHDIGYAGELHEPISRNLTITNKFFQYLQGGLAVVASDTAGQMEGASEAGGAVWVFRGGERMSLAEKLVGLLRDRGALQNTRHSAWQVGGRLNWENESPRLVEAVREAMEKLRQTRHGVASA